MFIVDLRLPGIDIRPIKQINGEQDFCEEFLTDVVVPAACLIGNENDGWSVVRGLLEIEHEWVGRRGWRGHTTPADVAQFRRALKRRGLDADVGARRQVAGIFALQAVQRALAIRVSEGIAAGALPTAYGGLLKLGNDNLRQRRSEAALSPSPGRAASRQPGGRVRDHRRLPARPQCPNRRWHRRDPTKQRQRARARPSARARARPR